MKTHNDQKAYGRWILGIVALCILIYLGVQNIGVVAGAIAWLFNLFTPLLLGVAFALIVNVPMRFIESHMFPKSQKKAAVKCRRPLSIILSYLLIVTILACIFGLVLPALVNAIKILFDSLANSIRTLSNMSVEDLKAVPFGEYIVNFDWQQPFRMFETFISNQGTNIMNTAVNAVMKLLGGVINLIVAIIFSIYVLYHKNTLKRQCRRLIETWLPKSVASHMIHTATVAGGVFRNFVAGQTLESIILGVLCITGMLILRIPYAPMIGAMIAVTALIPIVGPIIGTAIGAFMIFTIDPIKAVIFIVFMLILQQVEGNVIYPKVMGSTINLPAMWVLASVTIGGSLAGPVGMLLGVPVFSTIHTLLKEATEEREAKLAQKAENIQDDT